MAVLETGLYAYLAASTPITALVSDRIFPNAIPPAESYPCITFNRIGSEQPHYMLAAAAIQSARVQIDCWGRGRGGYALASAIAEAIRDRCDGYRGTMGSVAIHCSHLSDQRDDYEAPAEGSDIGIHKITQEYLLWYVIAAPTFV